MHFLGNCSYAAVPEKGVDLEGEGNTGAWKHAQRR